MPLAGNLSGTISHSIIAGPQAHARERVYQQDGAEISFPLRTQSAVQGSFGGQLRSTRESHLLPPHQADLI